MIAAFDSFQVIRPVETGNSTSPNGRFPSLYFFILRNAGRVEGFSHRIFYTGFVKKIPNADFIIFKSIQKSIQIAKRY